MSSRSARGYSESSRSAWVTRMTLSLKRRSCPAAELQHTAGLQALLTDSERKPVGSVDSVCSQSSWDSVPGRAPSSLQPSG